MNLTTLFEDIDNFHQQAPIKFKNSSDSFELHYAKQMTKYLLLLEENPSIALQIAARCQHLGRWLIPRNSYSMDKKGYLLWRKMLAKKHAQLTEELLIKHKLEHLIEEVSNLILKKNIKEKNGQIIEDCACLVFLQEQISDFVLKHSKEKIITIIQKTWKKMSSKGHELALQIPFDDKVSQLLKQALT